MHQTQIEGIATSVSLQEFTSFNWWCRQIDEDWPRDSDGNLLTTNPQTPYTTAQIAAGDADPDLGGCFRQGPGPVDFHGGTFSIDSENMHENETYKFAVEVIKGSRRAFAYLEVDIIANPPPSVEIE